MAEQKQHMFSDSAASFARKAFPHSQADPQILKSWRKRRGTEGSTGYERNDRFDAAVNGLTETWDMNPDKFV
jgi:hypothetical protein